MASRGSDVVYFPFWESFCTITACISIAFMPSFIRVYRLGVRCSHFVPIVPNVDIIPVVPVVADDGIHALTCMEST